MPVKCIEQSKPEGTKAAVASYTKAILIPSQKPLDQAAKAEQERRLERIRGTVELSEEVIEPLFEMKPEGKQDRYFTRLAKGAICSILSQTHDDAISMEVQTEPMYRGSVIDRETQEAGQTAPLDYGREFGETGKKREHDEAEIERFVDRMLPLIENITSQSVEEETELAGGKKTVVEEKGALILPEELRSRFGPATILSTFGLVSPVETVNGKRDANQLGVLYKCQTAEKQATYVICVYSMLTQQPLGYYAEERHKLSTIALLPLEEKLVVAGNTDGELLIYALKQNEAGRAIYTSYSGHKATIVSISVRGSVAMPRSALISTIDSTGTVCFWRLDPVTAGTDMTPSIEEFILGEYRLQLLERSELSGQFFLSDAVPTLVEIDPRDSNSYVELDYVCR